ncbi:hypothetical protein EBZ80_18320 [bacterium]|nr:hypothetical protein [Betaproteobacteria bacterium]NDE16883.1 hypothetical protein [bacterium]
MNKNEQQSMWPVFIVLLVIGTLISMVTANNVSPQRASFEPDSSSVEHRYVKERFKLEGYSDAESKQAADAIIKFHNAQQARQR